MKRILIVEDQELNRELLRELLERRGHQVMEASNGLEALELARRSPPDLLLADIRMPRMDGFSLVSAWRADPLLRPVAAVAISAFAMAADRERALQAGFDDYLSKPVDVEALFSTVQRLCGEDTSEPERR